jgi:two-component system chemotaxis response regulator CheY
VSQLPSDAARVLVVEDEALHRQTLEETLRAAGYLVETASDGQEGLEKVRSTRPDVLVTDWIMPRLDGVSLCRLVKANEALRSTYVVILSSRGESAEKVTGLDFGADDYLVKPVDANELLARVRAGLRLQRALAELAAKNELLERLALTDPLTQLANRRAFEESLRAEASRTFRHCQPLSLLYLDLDRFKEVNDRHGHAAGDEVLSGFADLLRKAARRGDVVARIGGEEFAVLLPHTDREQACRAAERIRKATEATPLGVRRVAVTVSIGVGVFAGSSLEEIPAFVADADGALYRAKAAGRNRVVASDGVSSGGRSLKG